MLQDIILQFNWFDVLVIILFFRICYVAIFAGLAIELFKLLGTIFAIYLSAHYFTAVSDAISALVNVKKLPLIFVDFISFLILITLGYLFFVVLRMIFSHFIKLETAPKISKIGGLIFGFMRGFLLIGLVAFTFFISTIGYIGDSVRKSYMGKYLVSANVGTYNWLWDTVASKFMRGEKFNETVLEIQEGLTKK